MVVWQCQVVTDRTLADRAHVAAGALHVAAGERCLTAIALPGVG